MDLKIAGTLVPIVLDTVFSEITKDIYTKVKSHINKNCETFIKNIDPDKLEHVDDDFLTRCIAYINVSQEDLVEVYSRIVNNTFSNPNKDKILSYFDILSKLTLHDLKILDDFYLNEKIEVTDINSSVEFSISINKLSSYFLIKRNNIRWKDFDGSLKGIYVITNVGKDFYQLIRKKTESPQ